MLAMHKTIARGYASQRILSFAITPGFTDTAMAGDYLASRGGPDLLRDIPLGERPRGIATGSGRLYLTDGKTGSLLIVDAADEQLVIPDPQ